MSSRTFPRVVVLKGGLSAEREVSLVSGREWASALRRAGDEVSEIHAGREGARALSEAAPDAVVNALHGRWGADGCVQGILEGLSIPYTHSGGLASARAMDKARTKEAYRAAGLPVAASLIAPRAEVIAGHPMAPPYVGTPTNAGSSVGLYFVHEHANGQAQLAA